MTYRRWQERNRERGNTRGLLITAMWAVYFIIAFALWGGAALLLTNYHGVWAGAGIVLFPIAAVLLFSLFVSSRVNRSMTDHQISKEHGGYRGPLPE